jgi:hypothetical protein
MEIVVLRKQAIQLNQKWYFTGEPCRKGHVARRTVANHTCTECQKIRDEKFRVDNPEYHHHYNKQYYPNNKERTHKHSTKFYASISNERLKEIIDQNSHKYRQKPEKREMNRKREHTWRRAFPGRINSYTAKRRAVLKNAVPVWANINAIREIYEECNTINIKNRLAGGTASFVVDHIIPLQGKQVSGLHVENNLRIIPDSENGSKSNKLLQEYTC